MIPILGFLAILSLGGRAPALGSSARCSAPAWGSGFLASVWQLLQAGLAASKTAFPAAASPARAEVANEAAKTARASKGQRRTMKPPKRPVERAYLHYLLALLSPRDYLLVRLFHSSPKNESVAFGP